VTFIEKSSLAVRPDGFLLKMPKKKRKHANPNFTTSSKIAILIITGFDGTGGVFSRDRSNPSSRNCGQHLVLEVNILSDIISGLYYS
jgi:hypothetical protein